MAKLKKLSNANYLRDIPSVKPTANETNRRYIDRFVSENYKTLTARFGALGNNINSSGFGALDKLNETILALYTNPDLTFYSWDEAKAYLKNKFTEKAIRVPVKKTNQDREESDEEEFINENNNNNE